MPTRKRGWWGKSVGDEKKLDFQGNGTSCDWVEMGGGCAFFFTQGFPFSRIGLLQVNLKLWDRGNYLTLFWNDIISEVVGGREKVWIDHPLQQQRFKWNLKGGFITPKGDVLFLETSNVESSKHKVFVLMPVHFHLRGSRRLLGGKRTRRGQAWAREAPKGSRFNYILGFNQKEEQGKKETRGEERREKGEKRKLGFRSSSSSSGTTSSSGTKNPSKHDLSIPSTLTHWWFSSNSWVPSDPNANAINQAIIHRLKYFRFRSVPRKKQRSIRKKGDSHLQLS